MPSTTQCLASLARLSLTPVSRPLASSVPRSTAPSLSQARFASPRAGGKKTEKKKKEHKRFRVWRKDALETFSLCDAIRYIRAFECGQSPQSVKYDLAIKLNTMKRSQIVRSRLRLPHPVRSDIRIGVICKEGGIVATEARLGGAVAVGEESIFQSVKEGTFDFNRLICHKDSLAAFQKANLGKILGPKGLVPSEKLGTVTNNVAGLLRDLTGAEDYREREGVVRMPVGQLSFTPTMLADNVKAVVAAVKKDIGALEGKASKSIDEIVLSSTHGPGFSLSGGYNSSDTAVTPAHLSGEM